MIDRASMAEAVLLAAWIGATVLFAAVVAPAAFAVLPTRALAGAVVARVLPALFIAGTLLGLAVAIGGAVKGRARSRVIAGAVLVLSCAISHFVVGARIASLREAIGPSLDAIAANDPRRATFGRLHGLSVAGLGVATLSAAVALWLAIGAADPLSSAGTGRNSRRLS